jgi:hypothetical protein
MEKHEKSFEEFDLRVEINDEGDVWITFHDSTKMLLGMTWDDLREVLDFAATHGLKMTNPYVVEYADTREAIEA